MLKHIGSLPAIDVDEDLPPTRIMEVCGNDYYVYSPDYGLWDPLVDLGDDVHAGQASAAVYCPQTPWCEPVLAQFAQPGTIICRRVPGLVERGDCLFHLVTDCSP